MLYILYTHTTVIDTRHILKDPNNGGLVQPLTDANKVHGQCAPAFNSNERE